MTDRILRKRLTTLELRVLRAAANGNVWDARAPGHGTRIYSQAIERLKRMGCIRADFMVCLRDFSCVVTEEGRKRIAEAGDRR